MSRLRNRVVFLCLVKLRNFHWPPLALQVKMLTVAQEALEPGAGPAPAPRLHPSSPCPCRSGLDLPSHARLLTQGWRTCCSSAETLGPSSGCSWHPLVLRSLLQLPRKASPSPRTRRPQVIFSFILHTVSFLVSCLSLPPARLWVPCGQDPCLPRAWRRVAAINSPGMISRKYK